MWTNERPKCVKERIIFSLFISPLPPLHYRTANLLFSHVDEEYLLYRFLFWRGHAITRANETALTLRTRARAVDIPLARLVSIAPVFPRHNSVASTIIGAWTDQPRRSSAISLFYGACSLVWPLSPRALSSYFLFSWPCPCGSPNRASALGARYRLLTLIISEGERDLYRYSFDKGSLSFMGHRRDDRNWKSQLPTRYRWESEKVSWELSLRALEYETVGESCIAMEFLS